MLYIIILVSVLLGLLLAKAALNLWARLEDTGRIGSSSPLDSLLLEATEVADAEADEAEDDDDGDEEALEAPRRQPLAARQETATQSLGEIADDYFEACCYVHAERFSTELEEPMSPRQKRYALQPHEVAPQIDLREFLNNFVIVLLANLHEEGYLELERKECEPLFPLVGPSRAWDVFVERRRHLPNSCFTRFLTETFEELEKRRSKRNAPPEITLGELLELALQRLVRSRGWMGRKGIYFDLAGCLKDSAERRGLLHSQEPERSLLSLKKKETPAFAAPEDIAASQREVEIAEERAEALRAADEGLYQGLALVVHETLYTLKAMEPDPDSIF